MIGFGKKTKKAITTLTDERLVKIDPQEPGFFDEVLNFKSTTDENINLFIEAVDEVKEVLVEAFYRVIYDPTETDDHMVDFRAGRKPAVEHSYNWWKETASKMPLVEGRHWHLATEYQYYAFLVWLINQLVKRGKSIEEALHYVVIDSEKLGHYFNSENSKEGEDLELTGSRCVCNIYDLANTFKYLQCSDQEVGGFWVAGGQYSYRSIDYPLVDIDRFTDVNTIYHATVGLLVL